MVEVVVFFFLNFKFYYFGRCPRYTVFASGQNGEKTDKRCLIVSRFGAILFTFYHPAQSLLFFDTAQPQQTLLKTQAIIPKQPVVTL